METHLEALTISNVSLSRECSLWKKLLALRCDDVDKFPEFYSDMVKVIHDLNLIKSKAITDDNFKRVFIHKMIDVDELRDSSKKLLLNFNKDAEELLKDVKLEYSTLRASEDIRENAAGSKLSTSVRRATEGTKPSSSSGEKKVSFKGTYITPFPKNTGTKIPQEIYAQVKSWYFIAAKKEKSSEDIKWLSDFKFEDRKTRAELDAKKAAKGGGSGKGRNPYRDQVHARRAGYDHHYDDGYAAEYHDPYAYYPPPAAYHGGRGGRGGRGRGGGGRGYSSADYDRNSSSARRANASMMTGGGRGDRY